VSELYTPPFLIIGGLLAWLTLYFFGFKKTMWAEFILGIVIFFLALIIQQPIQQLSLLGLGITSNQDIVARGALFTIETAVWLGVVAGLTQEGMKYLLVRKRSLKAALFVGLGFGIIEVVFLVVTGIISAASIDRPLEAPLGVALLSLFERYFAVLFHVATTIFLAYAYTSGFGKQGLASMVALHALIDSIAAYYQLTQSSVAMYLVEALFAIATILLIYYTIPKVKHQKIENREEVLW